MSEGEAPSFEGDIRPLFREKDQRAMGYAFDLFAYEDVKENATNILERIEDGTMPCDIDWPDEHLAVLRAWIAEGCPP